MQGKKSTAKRKSGAAKSRSGQGSGSTDNRKTAVPTASQQLKSCIDKFTPEIAALIRAVHRKMRMLVPNAVELVYDNYNFFVIGFAPGKRPSEAVFSIAADRNGVRICFLQGAVLADPHKLLTGSGTTVRNFKLTKSTDLDEPAVRDLITQAIAKARVPFSSSQARMLVLQFVSGKQRPRR